MSPSDRVSPAERARRWRLVLGTDAPDDGTDGAAAPGASLSADDLRIDGVLSAVYSDGEGGPSAGRGRDRKGSLGRSAPQMAQWLHDVRECFPRSVVQVVQRDAIDRLGLHQLLLEPELLHSVEPDLALVTLLVELSHLLPESSRAAARTVVQAVIDDLRTRLESRTVRAVHGALARSSRRRPARPADIDWDRTIRANLRTWTPELGSIIPERVVGHGRRERSLDRDVIIAIDQSASMAESVVHAAVLGAVLASIPSLRTHVVAFDTAVVDLTPVLHDPVDLLFGVQLGGGTDIGAAVSYCRTLVERPTRTLVVLVTDLFEGGNSDLLVHHAAELVASGTTVLVLLALADGGAPAYDHQMAARLAALGIESVACTPDEFPDLFARSLGRQ